MRFEHVGVLTSRPFNGSGYSLELQRSGSCRLRQRRRRWHVLTFYPKPGVRVRRSDRSGVFEADLTPGTLGLYPAGAEEAVQWSGRTVTAVHLHFDPARLGCARAALGLAPSCGMPRLPGFRDPGLAELLGALYDQARFHPGDLVGADALAEEILRSLAARIPAEAERPDIRIGALSGQALLDRMHGAPAIEATTAGLAFACGLSRASFYRHFAALFGASPHDHLIRSRLEFSKAALVRGSDPIAAIAADAGFADQAHFTRTFSARIGLAPGAYADLFGAR